MNEKVSESAAMAALRILKEKWKTYDRKSMTDDQNLAWLSGHSELLGEAGINRYIALNILKGVL